MYREKLSYFNNLIIEYYSGRDRGESGFAKNYYNKF
jgi:hypothetical protein